MRAPSLLPVVLLGVGIVSGTPICLERRPDGLTERCKETLYYPTPPHSRLKLYFLPHDVVEAQYVPEEYHYRPYYDNRLDQDEQWRRKGELWYFPPRRPRVRLGKGHFRLVGYHDAELFCDFPHPQDVISNVVWVRADLDERATRRLYGRLSGVAGRRGGSTLFLQRVTPEDTGLYRCLATARVPGTAALQTVYQDVAFFPGV